MFLLRQDLQPVFLLLNEPKPASINLLVQDYPLRVSISALIECGAFANLAQRPEPYDDLAVYK